MDQLRHQFIRLNETPEQHQTRLDGQRIRQNDHRTQSNDENKTFTEIASTIINDLETPIPSISDNNKFFDNATKPFIKQINKLKFLRCEDVVMQHGQPILKGCKEGFFSSTMVNKYKTCKSNNKKIMHRNPEERLSVRKFTQANNMDPFPCDKIILLPSFPDLTQIEEMLISLAHPIMSVYRIRHNIKYRGHCVTVPQDVQQVASKLPLLPSEAPCIIVRRSTHTDPNEYKHFRVRKDVIRQALIWLKSNNHLYRDIIIDENVLSQLPDDGNVGNDIRTVIEDERQENIGKLYFL